MGKLRKKNVPNASQQQIQSNENRAINKRKLRRFILVFMFIFSTTLYMQNILHKQVEMIGEKQGKIKKQSQQLITLKKNGDYLKNEVGNLTDNEEQILKFARKEYQFSKPNEIVFALSK